MIYFRLSISKIWTNMIMCSNRELLEQVLLTEQVSLIIVTLYGSDKSCLGLEQLKLELDRFNKHLVQSGLCLPSTIVCSKSSIYLSTDWSNFTVHVWLHMCVCTCVSAHVCLLMCVYTYVSVNECIVAAIMYHEQDCAILLLFLYSILNDALLVIWLFFSVIIMRTHSIIKQNI